MFKYFCILFKVIIYKQVPLKIRCYIRQVKNRKIDSSVLNLSHLENGYRNDHSTITDDDTFSGLLIKGHGLSS